MVTPQVLKNVLPFFNIMHFATVFYGTSVDAAKSTLFQSTAYLDLVVSFDPFKADKTAASSNLGQCLKWKPQVKCH